MTSVAFPLPTDAATPSQKATGLFRQNLPLLKSPASHESSRNGRQLLQILLKFLDKIKTFEGLKIHLCLLHTYLSNSHIHVQKNVKKADFWISSAWKVPLAVKEEFVGSGTQIHYYPAIIKDTLLPSTFSTDKLIFWAQKNLT